MRGRADTYKLKSYLAPLIDNQPPLQPCLNSPSTLNSSKSTFFHLELGHVAESIFSLGCPWTRRSHSLRRNRRRRSLQTFSFFAMLSYCLQLPVLREALVGTLVCSPSLRSCVVLNDPSRWCVRHRTRSLHSPCALRGFREIHSDHFR